jgi:TPP-dependent pyruvate/acetoin dehydrogenase alpha subunit
MEAELDRERLNWMYRQMLRIREFEERVKSTFTAHPGVIRGHTHLADGAEASIVGSLAALRPGDQVMATYRCHGYPLVMGSDPNAMMAELRRRPEEDLPPQRRADVRHPGLRGAGLSEPKGGASRARPVPSKLAGPAL